MSGERGATITVLAHSDDERDVSAIHGRLDPPRVVDGVLVIPGWVVGRNGEVTAVEVRDETGSVVRTSATRVLRARASGELRSTADLATVPGIPDRLRTELEGRIAD